MVTLSGPNMSEDAL